MCKIVLILSGLLLLCSCSLTETTELEVNPKPTLTVSYRYLNKEGVNTTRDEIRSMSVFVFDPDGRFIAKTEASGHEATDSDGLQLLSGVPAGEYTVVAYANVEKLGLPKLVPGESCLNDLTAVDKNRETCSDADRLFHNLTRIKIQREQPQVRMLDLGKRYFQINLTLTGADKLNVPPDKIAVLFSGIPAGADYKGDPVTAQTVFSPYLDKTPQGFSASFNVYRFGTGDNVKMAVQAGTETVGPVDLGEYITRNDIGIDLNNDRDIVLPIDIDVTSVGITIVINDWDAGAIQLPIVGK